MGVYSDKKVALTRPERCAQTKSRNAERKARNIEAEANRFHRTATEQLAYLNSNGYVAKRERARIAKKSQAA